MFVFVVFAPWLRKCGNLCLVKNWKMFYLSLIAITYLFVVLNSIKSIVPFMRCVVKFWSLILDGFLICLLFCNALELDNEKNFCLSWFFVLGRTVINLNRPKLNIENILGTVPDMRIALLLVSTIKWVSSAYHIMYIRRVSS